MSMQALIDRATISASSLADYNDQLLDYMGDGGRRIHESCTAAGEGDGNSEPSNSSDAVNRALYCIYDNIFSEVPSVEIVSGLMKASQAELLSHACMLTDVPTASESLSMASAFVEACMLTDNVTASETLYMTSAFLDKTDLDLQYAISMGGANSLLLANYAQFLFLITKDQDRAEELFRRALVCDPLDGNTISRFASFLWLGRHNLAAAGKACQAAICTDPAIHTMQQTMHTSFGVQTSRFCGGTHYA